MGRGMLRNIVKKTNERMVSIYDVNQSNIDDFMKSLTAEEAIKVRICRSPEDVSYTATNLCRDTVLCALVN